MGQKNYIPKESIERAVAYFEELFWLWTDRFFDCIAPLDAAIRQSTDKVNALVTEYNQQRSELKEATKEMMEQRETKKQQTKPPAFNPLLANPLMKTCSRMKFRRRRLYSAGTRPG